MARRTIENVLINQLHIREPTGLSEKKTKIGTRTIQNSVLNISVIFADEHCKIQQPIS